MTLGRLCHVETNPFGITRQFYIDDKGNVTVNAIQDVEANLENNKANAAERGKRITSEVSNPVAHIPHIVGLKWLAEEGWWWMDADKDPGVDKKLKQKLNSSEWRHLRTSELVV